MSVLPNVTCDHDCVISTMLYGYGVYFYELVSQDILAVFYVILHRVWLESCNQTTITQLATGYMNHGIQVNFTTCV